MLLPPSTLKPKPSRGLVFGNWTVLRELRFRSKTRQKTYACICRCGHKDILDQYHLHRLNKACVKCRFNAPQGIEVIHWQSTHAGSVYGYMLKLEREQNLKMYEPWRKFNSFLEFYCALTETPKEVALQRPLNWSYFEVTRIDTSKNFSPENITCSKFVQERAAHTNTRRYWRSLSSKGLLTEDLAESYIAFVNTFGLRPYYQKLIRHDNSKPHSADNSRWNTDR
jgi:hypothetical protein